MRYFLFLLLLTSLSACKIFQSNKKSSGEFLSLPVVEVNSEDRSHEYRASKDKLFDLIHTKLWVDFDWKKKRMNGKAELTLKPHFYPQTILELDAKGFDIHDLVILDSSNKIKVPYHYDSLKIKINLPKVYTATDTIKISIAYTAKPDEFKAGGSKAIHSDKGLYFINPDGAKNKPQQIWTQGETEASSRWFPTLDAPNQKTSQEIFITVDSQMVTLSNGHLVYSIENPDGTRTDYWKQDKPHAPYLVMLAAGKFSIIKDEWIRGSGESMPVYYYIEKEYEAYAKKIFGNTPEMIQFFSKKLGIEYPWDKYHQIVIRDFVSGAMENTGAVTFMEALNQTDRELLDKNYEYIISHELFHHWFGDFVTTESWSNLPLNESFANYGQYLWEEFKYGQEEADYNIYQDFLGYLIESKERQVPLIRYHYNQPEDMFDSHSYNKGGCILHMLRKQIGDEAFFNSLHKYLTDNAYQSAEIDHLRLAVEEVTGQDFHWFFNQWFFQEGHPIVSIESRYDSIHQKLYVYTQQSHSVEKHKPYTLPLNINIYLSDSILKNHITLKNILDTFIFSNLTNPHLVKADPERSLVGILKEKKDCSAWAYQYNFGLNLGERVIALNQIARECKSKDYTPVILAALNDKHWSIRESSLDYLERVELRDVPKNKLIQLTLSDPKSSVRAKSMRALHDLYGDSIQANFYLSLLDDPSYLVISEALDILYNKDPAQGLKTAQILEIEPNKQLQLHILNIYAKEGIPNKNKLFTDKIHQEEDYSKASVLMSFQKYITHTNLIESEYSQGLSIFEQGVMGNDENHIKLYSIICIKNSLSLLEQMSKKESDDSKKALLQSKVLETKSLITKLRNEVTDEELKMYLEDPASH